VRGRGHDRAAFGPHNRFAANDEPRLRPLKLAQRRSAWPMLDESTRAIGALSDAVAAMARQ
jgi:hypothetical protein